MKFARNCPKCGGEIQTKSIKKSIGLGFVDIPVAQFCLNPACDWYQDFSEAKKPEEIKENVIQIRLPSIEKTVIKEIIISGIITGIIAVFLILSSINLPEYHAQSIQPAPLQTNVPPIAPNFSAGVITRTPQSGEQKEHLIKLDEAHGFVPAIRIINRSDTVKWINEENQRPRIYLISKDGLFDNRLMQYTDRFSYQFNRSGNYTFVLVRYDPFNQTINEFPNTTGSVTVN